ncbi:hypothetical protein ED733_000350 [Metarhizium rileyi]|uniref:Uncharacterized protein n=1 Tax=Metarhizium rileyi (strain RCEF 4871) TaxID=1649241 RepID=A0A5C6FZD6_METRR|nr:hypothetical protein ED733_000350 [Metarhizium rileyi]
MLLEQAVFLLANSALSLQRQPSRAKPQLALAAAAATPICSSIFGKAPAGRIYRPADYLAARLARLPAAASTESKPTKPRYTGYRAAVTFLPSHEPSSLASPTQRAQSPASISSLPPTEDLFRPTYAGLQARLGARPSASDPENVYPSESFSDLESRIRTQIRAQIAEEDIYSERTKQPGAFRRQPGA